MGLVVSAFLAVYLDEAVYSVASIASTLILVALLYSLNGASYAAVFQLGMSAGTIAILFLSGETLSKKITQRGSLRKTFAVTVVAILLSIPSIIFSTGTTSAIASSEVSFPEALWNLRSIDIVLQGLVVMTVALGVAIVLYSKKEGDN